MNAPVDVIENHKTLVKLLLDMQDEDSETACLIRKSIKNGNGIYPDLEKIYIEMMADKERNGTGATGV